jgi:hypothetical protein
MAIGLQVWSKTAASNSNADTNINWAEQMAPSQVNDSARAEMASMALWRDDNNCSIVTGGSSTAYTATSNQIEAALTSGYTIGVQFHATNDSSATLAVDGLTAKPLQVVSGTNLKGGEFRTGSMARFTYSTTGTGQWIAQGADQTTPGITDASNAFAGNIGEYTSTLVTSGSAINLADGVATNITSLALTAGDWDLWGELFILGSNTVINANGAISQASAETTATGFTMPVDGYDFVGIAPNATPGSGRPLSISGLRTRASSASGVTYYLNFKGNLGGNMNVYGGLRARRMR